MPREVHLLPPGLMEAVGLKTETQVEMRRADCEEEITTRGLTDHESSAMQRGGQRAGPVVSKSKRHVVWNVLWEGSS